MLPASRKASVLGYKQRSLLPNGGGARQPPNGFLTSCVTAFGQF